MIQSLQIYRGFAALLVVLYHANEIVYRQLKVGNDFTRFFKFGKFGVEFFFVLSGFIIYYIHRRDIGKGAELPRYTFKRFARIYPIYWIVLAIYVALRLVSPDPNKPHLDGLLPHLKSLFLIPQENFPHVGVAWTLSYEVFFYLLFGVLIFNRWAGVIVLGLWFAAAAVVRVAAIELSYPLAFLCSDYNLLFLLGMAAAHLHQGRIKFSVPANLLLFLLGNALFLACGVLYVRGAIALPYQTISFGVAAFFIVLACGKSSVVERILSKRRFLILIGSASYSIYLTHRLFLWATYKACGKVEILGGLPTTALFILGTLVALACGIGFHLVAEKPLLDWSRRRIARGGGRSPKT